MKWKQNRYAVNSQITQRPRKLSGAKEELRLIVLDAVEKASFQKRTVENLSRRHQIFARRIKIA
jgi:hypothetical protein